MTTVLLNYEDNIVYSDSRRTLRTNGVESFDSKGEKIFKHPNGKMLAVCCGDLRLCADELVRLGFKVKTNYKGIVPSQKGLGNVIVTSTYTTSACIIGIDSKGKSISYFRGGTCVWGGSGGGVVTKLSDKGLTGTQVIRYAAMKDKYTDDEVQKVRL